LGSSGPRSDWATSGDGELKTHDRLLGALFTATLVLAGAGCSGDGEDTAATSVSADDTVQQTTPTAVPTTTTVQEVVAERIYERGDSNGDPYEVTVAIVSVQRDVQNDGVCSQADLPSGSTLVAVQTTYNNPNDFDLEVNPQALIRPDLPPEANDLPLLGRYLTSSNPCASLSDVPTECETCIRPGPEGPLAANASTTVQDIFIVTPSGEAASASIAVFEGTGTEVEQVDQIPY